MWRSGKQSGWDLLERLLAEPAATGIPVLVTSTSPALLEQAREQASRYGRHRSYLTKPMDLDELLVSVRQMAGDTF